VHLTLRQAQDKFREASRISAVETLRQSLHFVQGFGSGNHIWVRKVSNGPQETEMISSLTKSWPYIFIALFLILFQSFVYYPNISLGLSSILLVSGLGMAVFFTVQKHAPQYKQGQITRLKFTRNILLDLLGLLLTIGAASYLGAMAGRWASNYGLWTGLAAGMIIGFAGAFWVRLLWGKVMRVAQA
jgi:hypothetical protein